MQTYYEISTVIHILVNGESVEPFGSQETSLSMQEEFEKRVLDAAPEWSESKLYQTSVGVSQRKTATLLIHFHK
ncbi:MAG: hypothetical protein AAFY41_10840 [Bacteroidota bacterium]